ncbi:MAG: tetratricopeptide repeat protein [Candidatus Hodarchaeales archaeon]|jgi:tetratricopeptide (TPR) repeat protein
MNLSELLSSVRQLKKQGNFKVALSEIEQIERTTNLSDEDRLACLCQKQELFLKLGEFSSVLQIGSQLIKESEKLEKHLQTVDAIGLNATALRMTGRYKEALALVEKCEQILKTVTDIPRSEKKIREARSLLRKGSIYCYGFLDNDYASERVHESLAIFEELGNKTGIAWCYDLLANTIEKDPDLTIEIHHKALVLFEEISDKEGIGWSHFSIGVIHRYKGEMEKASKHLLKSLAIFEETDNKFGLAYSYGSLGRLYVSKGELSQAMQHLEKSRILYKEIGNKFWIGLNLGRIGDLYFIKGELDLSLESYLNSIANYKEVERSEYGKGLTFSKIGRVYHARGEFDEADKYYQKSLAIYEENEDLRYKHFPLYNLIKLSIERKDPERAKLYVQRLRQVNDQDSSKYIDQFYRVGKATVLKTSNRVIHKAEAQKLFQQVVKERVTDIEISVDAILNLCELLLDEYRAYKDEEVFQEVKELSNKLLRIANDQNSYSLLGEAYLLQSKLALLNLEVKKAQKLLIQGKIIAEEKGLQKLANILIVESNLLEEQMTTWEQLMEKDLSKGEMIELTQFEDLLERMLNKRLYRSDEEVSEYIEKARQIVETMGS